MALVVEGKDENEISLVGNVGTGFDMEGDPGWVRLNGRGASGEQSGGKANDYGAFCMI